MCLLKGWGYHRLLSVFLNPSNLEGLRMHLLHLNWTILMHLHLHSGKYSQHFTCFICLCFYSRKFIFYLKFYTKTMPHSDKVKKRFLQIWAPLWLLIIKAYFKRPLCLCCCCTKTLQWPPKWPQLWLFLNLSWRRTFSVKNLELWPEDLGISRKHCDCV